MVDKRWCVNLSLYNSEDLNFYVVWTRLVYGGPKGSNTNRFPKTQINFPKHKSVSQNTNQFPKTQIDFQNTNQFSKTQINFPKHKSISRITYQFPSQKTGHYLNMNKITWKAEWWTRIQGANRCLHNPLSVSSSTNFIKSRRSRSSGSSEVAESFLLKRCNTVLMGRALLSNGSTACLVKTLSL